MGDNMCQRLLPRLKALAIVCKSAFAPMAPVPPEVRDKMFNPFFTTQPAGEGTGLGLSISHDIIVKQHGVSIEVDTEPAGFTEIRVILPRAAAFYSPNGRDVLDLEAMTFVQQVNTA
jgi:Histidine kinase-, DNA gyrase B-, and HSP90-like ATPase